VNEANDRPWHLAKGAVVVRVRVTPKSSKDVIDGLENTAEGAAFKARVRAVPADGEANSAVVALLAAWLGVAKGRIELVSGAKSRVKSFAVSGEPGQLEVMLKSKLEAPAPQKR